MNSVYGLAICLCEWPSFPFLFLICSFITTDAVLQKLEAYSFNNLNKVTHMWVYINKSWNHGKCNVMKYQKSVPLHLLQWLFAIRFHLIAPCVRAGWCGHHLKSRWLCHAGMVALVVRIRCNTYTVPCEFISVSTIAAIQNSGHLDEHSQVRTQSSCMYDCIMSESALS